MNTEQHTIVWNEESVHLTATEFAILEQFMQHPTRVFSRDSIMSCAYQFNIHVSDRTIDSHIRNLRAKLADAGLKEAITTVHGVGLRMGPCQA